MYKSKQRRRAAGTKGLQPAVHRPAKAEEHVVRVWSRRCAYAAAIVVLLGLGLLHGAITDRWGTPVQVQKLAKRLHRLPSHLGDRWISKSIQLDPSVLASAGIMDYTWRRFKDQVSGTEFELFVAAGRPGPISTHTPDECFRGLGYEPIARLDSVSIDLAKPAGLTKARFHSAVFRRKKADATQRFRVFWSWNGGHGWVAPSNPRLRFASSTALYKLYVVSPATSAPLSREEPTGFFIRDLLKHLDRALFEEVNG